MDWLFDPAWNIRTLFADFHFTPTQLAFAVPIGAISAAYLSYLGARRGSKDLKHNQILLTAAQKENQEKLLEAQRQQFLMQRSQALYDKQAISYEKLMVLLFEVKALPGSTDDKALFIEYLKQDQPWLNSVATAVASVSTYATESMYAKVQESYKHIALGVQFINEQIRTMLANLGSDTLMPPPGQASPGSQDERVKMAYRIADQGQQRLNEEVNQLIKHLRDDIQSSMIEGISVEPKAIEPPLLPGNSSGQSTS